MEENTELEEGEACYSKDDNEASTDLDSLSYIDERIQHVLGHFQKDFEGGVSAENLGAKFGGYGSFLATHERSPCSWPRPKTPQRNHSSPKSTINLQAAETVSHDTKAPPNVPPLARPENASHSSQSSHDLKAAPANDSVKKDTGISSSDVAERCTLKDDTAKKTGNSTDQRTLKFRIKMKPNILAQKRAEIYSGLGLDNSPSSSMGNSPVESEGKPPVSQQHAEDSPTCIILDMTSFPIPGGILTSPLHESFLCLIKNGKANGDNRYLSSLNGQQDRCSMSTDESDSFAGDGHLKKRTVRIVRQSEKQLDLKDMNGTLSENDMKLNTKKRLGNRTPDRKDFVSNDLKYTPLSSSICDAGEAAEVTAKTSEAFKKVNDNGVRGRMVSAEPWKEESLESISGQDFEKVEKQNAGNGFMKNVSEHKLENSWKDNSSGPKNNDKCNAYTISNRVEHEAVKRKVDEKHETHQKAMAVSDRKNKSKGDQNPGKAEAAARKDSFGGGNDAVVIDKGSTGFDITSRSKMNRSKSLKDNMFTDSNKDMLKEKKTERKVESIAGNGAIKTANVSNEKQSVFGAKVKERCNKVVNQLLDGPSVKDASGSLNFAGNNPAPEMIPSAVSAPQLIAEDWVCCDSCEQWRLLPTGTKPEDLPENWLCSMLNWLPGMNSCDFSENETTKALYDLYQIPMPISEGQNNMQSNGTRTAIGVSATDALQFVPNHKMPSSDVLSDRGKKKNVIKEKSMSGNDDMLLSNSAKTNGQVSGKNRNLIHMNQHAADLNLKKKMSFSKPLSRFDNMSKEKHVPEEKENQVNEGDRKHVKLKRKMGDDQYRLGIPKKAKTENVSYADKQLNPGTIGLETVALNSRNSLPTKASGKDMRKYDEYCLSEDVHDRLPVAVKKERDQAQVSSGSGSLDGKNRSKNDNLMKKRKLKDRLDDENHNNSYSLHGEKQYGEEGDASEYRKEKKHRILNKEAKSITEADKLCKGGMRQVSLSGSRDQIAVGTELRYVDKGHPLRKHRKNIAPHQASDGVDPLSKDLSSGQLSLAATSSSSKVSGSRKAKTHFQDVRGSPVESVTSSPLRASNLSKNVLAVGCSSVKDDATKGCLSSIGSRRNVDNREGKLSVKLHPASRKLSSKEHQVEDAKDRTRVQVKNSSELKNNHLLEDGVCVEPHGSYANGHHEEKVKKENQESELSWPKPGKVTSLHSKEKDRRSGSHVGADKMKVSVLETGYSKNSGRHDSAVDPSYHASGIYTRNDAKSKCKIDSISQKSALRHGSSETGKKTELRQSGLKMDAQGSTDRKTISQQIMTQDFEEENKANHVSTDLGDGKSKVLSSAVNEVKRETLNADSRTVPQHRKGGLFNNKHPAHVSGNGDLANSMGNCADAPDQQLAVSSPLRANSNQTGTDTLEEATKLKDRADHYKNSGFDFESNETYFEAGLKFLHGASLLENCHNESSKHGEMSEMQIYVTAAKLFKSCAREYENRQEMAAATLAYKCMEVAYLRMVYSKHSSTNRDRHELQSTLQMVSQGESPSSSASDVDNLNNQAAIDKASLPRGTNTHVAVNQVISARTHPHLARLLDFTQLMHFAMEASKKCQSTFAAANVLMEEARNKDCITSIKNVMDFSFQDVDELLHRVWIATKAISRAGPGGARD